MKQTIASSCRISPLTFSSLSIALILLTACCLGVNAAREEVTEFDLGALRNLGLDEELAKRFSHAGSFPPGENIVNLTVNGSSRGRARVFFDDRGHLCADAELLRQAGLVIPHGVPEKAEKALPCFDLQQAWKQFASEASPEEGRLELRVAQEVLTRTNDDPGRWQQGGSAALLNYSAAYLASRAQSGTLDYWQLQTEAGLNIDNWVLRSHQHAYRFAKETRVEFQDVSILRSVVSLRSTLLAGQIDLSAGLFGIGQVLGLQITPETSLYPDVGVAVISGIADTSSVVELSQLGSTVYRTSVPPGPFTLDNFPLLNMHADITVTLSGTDGSRKSYLVSPSSYAREGMSPEPGTTWGIGRYYQPGANRSPVVGIASQGFTITPHASLLAGGLVADNYQACALLLRATMPWGMVVSVQEKFSQATSPRARGSQPSFSFSQKLTDHLTLSMNVSRQGHGYRELSEAQMRSRGGYARNRDRSSTGVSWWNNLAGSFTFNGGRSTRDNGGSSFWTQLGWGKQFGRVTLHINATRTNSTFAYGRDDRLYLSLQLPLGQHGSLSTSITQHNKHARYGLRTDQRLDQDRSWSLSLERDDSNRLKSATGTMSTMTE